MGYSRTVPSNTLTVTGGLINEEEFRTTGWVSSGSLGQIILPDYSGELLYACLLYNSNMFRNTNAGTNWFHDFKIELSNDGGVNWHTVISGFAPMLRISATSNVFGLFTFVDGSDIKSYLYPNATLLFRYAKPDTHVEGDSIYVYSAFLRLELMFK